MDIKLIFFNCTYEYKFGYCLSIVYIYVYMLIMNIVLVSKCVYVDLGFYNEIESRVAWYCEY